MKKKKSKIKMLKWMIPLALLVIVFAITLTVDLVKNLPSGKIDTVQAQKIVNSAFASLPDPISPASKTISKFSEISVNGIRETGSGTYLLSCTYKTKDLYGTLNENLGRLMSDVYSYYTENEAAGIKTNATKVMLYIGGEIDGLIGKAPDMTGDIDIQLCYGKKGYEVYFEDSVINTCFGGILDAREAISECKSVTVDGKTVSITANNTLRNGCINCIKLINYSNEKPEPASFYLGLWTKFSSSFRLNFGNGNWQYLTRGLITTVEITFLSLLLGLLIGFVAAIVRCTYDKTGKLETLNAIFKAYITVIRGTPVMIQLLIIYFVILLPAGVQKFPAAVLCFGINSGSYVAEIVRGGLMSVDSGQDEAGRSLGFNYVQTMIYVIIPQAFKAVLPALANEFITLLKETSVAFYIGVADLTQGGLKIRSITYSNFMPLVAVALIYFVIVYILTKLVSLLEKRLRKSER